MAGKAEAARLEDGGTAGRYQASRRALWIFLATPHVISPDEVIELGRARTQPNEFALTLPRLTCAKGNDINH